MTDKVLGVYSQASLCFLLIRGVVSVNRTSFLVLSGLWYRSFEGETRIRVFGRARTMRGKEIVLSGVALFVLIQRRIPLFWIVE